MLFVKVPDDAYDFKVLDKIDILIYETKVYKGVFGGLGDYRMLKSDGFDYIGLTSEVTEEQAKMMVDKFYRGYNYNNYLNGKIFDTALDSFKSLMQHLQVYEVNPFLVEPLYTRAESRTGKWIVLFKPNES